MEHRIEVNMEDYRKGIEAQAKIDIICTYLNENHYITGNDLRMIVGLPKVDRWGEVDANVVTENMESN